MVSLTLSPSTADRRLGLGGYLDQVQFSLSGELSCSLDGDDSHLLARGVIEEAD